MRKLLLPWTAGLGTAISLVFSSCTYDPYYSSSGGYYGYGDGYGYGNSSFSTSLFVSTGDSRWGYDPNTYCYYDYSSRRYYDPYLYGYYPVGYRPYAVYGAPHPHGWRPGSRHCPPPRTVRNVTVVNYRDRESAYRNSNYSWARQVRQRPSGGSYRPPSSGSRSYSGSRDGYRTSSPDYRTNSSNRRGSQNSQVWPSRENRTPQATPYSRGGSDPSNRSNYRPAERSSPQQAVRTDYRPSTREVRPESSRGQSMQRPQPSRQFERPQENRSRGAEQPRQQAPASNTRESLERKAETWKSEHKGLRSLGNG